MRLTFKTPRLTMRPFEADDAPRIAYLAGEYDVAKMCGRVPHPYSVDMAEQWLLRHRAERQRKIEFTVQRRTSLVLLPVERKLFFLLK